MSLASLNRWQWVVIAVLFGVLGGFAFQGWVAEPYGPFVRGMGYQLTDQSRFESSVVGELAGQKLFKDLVIHPRWIVDGRGRSVRVDVVAGLYCDGRVTGTGNEATAAWNPTCFIASRPYQPKGNAPWFHTGGTVADYLAGLTGVHSATAWWEAYPFVTAVVASLVLVGGVWPTIVNLIAFGKLTRPPEARGMSLWRVKAPPQVAAPRPESLALSTEFEQKFSPDPDATEEPASPVQGEPSSTDVTPLTADPLPTPAEQEKAAAEFAKRKEDYYPTVKRGSR